LLIVAITVSLAIYTVNNTAKMYIYVAVQALGAVVVVISSEGVRGEGEIEGRWRNSKMRDGRGSVLRGGGCV
jgi:hypothetical protein